MRTKELFAFIRERHAIYERRRAGNSKPWTRDPILQQYRFCNVYRELDMVTAWIRENWREPNRTDPDVWFAMTVARLLNKPESLAALDVRRHVLRWDPKSFKKIMRLRKEAGEKVFSAAYMIHADAVETGLKTDYLADFVLASMWKEREALRPRSTNTLAAFHARLMTQRDMGSFMAGQVVADTKFTALLEKAPDFWTWATPGPGSMRGLNRVCGYSIERSWQDGAVNHWHPTLFGLLTGCLASKVGIDQLTREAEMPRISAQDLQNCLCEFDKYERARLGEGRPKQRYPGAA